MTQGCPRVVQDANFHRRARCHNSTVSNGPTGAMPVGVMRPLGSHWLVWPIDQTFRTRLVAGTLPRASS